MLRRLMLVLMLLLLPSFAQATTYWVSPTGGATLCTQIDGSSDPGVYMTPAALIANACHTTSDTVMFKAGTYTTAIVWTNLIKSGTAGAYFFTLCETHRGCTIQPSTSVALQGVVTPVDKAYSQFGSSTGGFIIDAVNAGADAKGIFWSKSTSVNVTGGKIIGNLIRNHHSDGIAVKRSGAAFVHTGMTIERNTVEAGASPISLTDGQPHAIYMIGTLSTIQNNELATNNNTVSGSYGIHCYPVCTSNVITHNRIHQIGLDRGILVSGNTNQISHNVVWGGTGICLALFGTSDNNDVWNNTCHGTNTWLFNGVGATGNEARNNVCTVSGSCGTTLNGETVTQSNNSTAVALSQFNNAAGGDLSLVAGSTLINAGVDVGLPFHLYSGHTAPDRGAHQFVTFTTGSCTGQTCDLQIDLNTHTPFVPGTLGYSLSDSRTVTDVELVGSSVVRLTYTGTCTGGTASYTEATGSAKDSSLIGTASQRLWDTGPVTLTNDCVGGPAMVLTQKRHQFYESHYLPGTTTKVLIGAQQASITKFAGESFAVETQTDATVAGGSIAQKLYYERNDSGTPLPVTDDCTTADQICFVGTATDPTDLLNENPATCLAPGALDELPGSTQITADAVPVTTFTTGSCTDHIRVLKFGTSAVATDTYDLLEYQQTGVVFDAYDPVGGARVTVEGVAPGIQAPTGLKLAGITSATDVTLIWSPNAHVSFAGYHIYRSTTSGVYGSAVADLTPSTAALVHRPVTSWSTQIATPGTYYFVVTAFDHDNNESVVSNEVSVTLAGFTGRTPASTRTPR